jgi:phage terminase large subunit-like protein
MVNPEEGRREKWAVSKIAVDHPKRRLEGIRDWTIATAGLTTNTTGWHADIIVPDDVVVPDNAYTEEGRRRVVNSMSQMTSIRNAGGFTKACGTRYHPSDIYDVWKKQTMILYDEETQEVVDKVPVWDVKEHAVEKDGFFLWPREVRADGKSFGFNLNVLSRIRGEYEDTTQFFAQYYNDPNDPGSQRISRDKFQYYDQKFLKQSGGTWYFKGKRLNVYASIDFAFSLSKAADYTAIVVIGICPEGNIYLLDIERFKSDRTIEYFQKIISLHSKWDFRKLRAEVSVGQKVIVNDLKDLIKKNGLSLSVDMFNPTRNEGTKEERIAATLEYRYENQIIWHFKGGYTPVLEEELILARPPHDDIKDALASAIAIAIKPKQAKTIPDLYGGGNIVTHKRFGGVAFR